MARGSRSRPMAGSRSWTRTALVRSASAFTVGICGGHPTGGRSCSPERRHVRHGRPDTGDEHGRLGRHHLDHWPKPRLVAGWDQNRVRANQDLFLRHLPGGHLRHDSGRSTQVRRLTNSQGLFDYYGHPAWSPDGRKIAYRRNRYGNGGLYTMDPDGSGRTQARRYRRGRACRSGRRTVWPWRSPSSVTTARPS